MAALLDISRRTAEPSLVIKWNGMPASFRWRGEMHETAVLHTWWEDGQGRTWYRVESTEGRLFLLGSGRDGWLAAPLLSGPAPASGGERAG
ncbi:MAG: hypothetical protein ACOY94_20050 [Bacillota bacterium]